MQLLHNVQPPVPELSAIMLANLGQWLRQRTINNNVRIVITGNNSIRAEFRERNEWSGRLVWSPIPDEWLWMLPSERQRFVEIGYQRLPEIPVVRRSR